MCIHINSKHTVCTIKKEDDDDMVGEMAEDEILVIVWLTLATKTPSSPLPKKSYDTNYAVSTLATLTFLYYCFSSSTLSVFTSCEFHTENNVIC